jgi:glycerol-3-phosphate acyltransferase PlsX
MGGDHAPREVVKGAVLAAKELPDLDLHLVGLEDAIRAELAECDASDADRIHVVPATEVVGMGESPVVALRQKKDSSIARALKLVRDGEAQAFVSAGNTGACVAAATLLLRTLPAVKKAGIAVAFTVGTKPVVLLDAGANVEARPDHLFQYGVMASLYVSEILGIQNPRIGLLNVGGEGAKGNRLVKETHDLFQSSDLNFHGNVEGVEIFRGVCDVVVCDGFTGNIVLKVSEGIAERLFGLFKESAEQLLAEFSDAFGSASSGRSASPDDGGGGELRRPSGLGQMARDGVKRAFGKIKERLDYAEFGGAPLLGLRGNVIVAHGRSDSRAILNAIRVAKRMTDVDITRRIVEDIRKVTGDDIPAQGEAVSHKSVPIKSAQVETAEVDSADELSGPEVVAEPGDGCV